MQNLVITNRGEALIAKLVAGTSTAVFTKVAASDYDYVDVDLKSLVELNQVRQTVVISGVSRTDTNMVEVLAAMENSELESGYYTRALGVYAQDSDENEILFAVSIETENPSYLPAFGGKTVSSITYRLNIKVDNSEQVKIEVNPGAYPTIEQLDAVQKAGIAHSENLVYGENGVHGLRFYQDEIQVMNQQGEWVELQSGGIAPSNVINPRIKVGNKQLTISWGDPDDTVVDGQTLCTWKGTKLVQKVGAFPENNKDGIQLVDNRERNAYQDNGFVISNLTNEMTYYFALFPYSDTGASNTNEGNRLSGTPQSYKVMTAVIDLSNSNPETSVTYADDAVGMSPKSEEWDAFFGHYPVLFQDGVEVGRLNPNNFAQFEDGSAADITSGDAGDVMIAFPRRGVKITTVGTTLKVSMTNVPDKVDFKYYAHERGNIQKEKFYLGTYEGYVNDSKLRSLSGKTPKVSTKIGASRTNAHNMGTGYEIFCFYQLTFLQVMYILKYKDLNSQAALGFGRGGGTAISTGITDVQGMDYGTPDKNNSLKLFGIENLWGNTSEMIDGIVSDSTRNILVTTDNFNDAGSGYKDLGQGATQNIHGFISKPRGTTETGFLLKEGNGSETTFFCDSGNLYDSSICVHGCSGEGNGVFGTTISFSPTAFGTNTGARLMYL